MIEIREGVRADACLIAALHAESWRTAYRGMLRDEFLDKDVFADRLAVWQSRFDSPHQHQGVFVIVDRGVLVGFACVFGNADPQYGALLDNLHVLPTKKGHGLGRQLLHRVTLWLRERLPGQGMFLWVYEDNSPARRFYQQLGGREHERAVVSAPGGGEVAEIRYVWSDVENLYRDTSPSPRSSAYTNAIIGK
jgi:GNAT superfamily N-acetyltransferase